MKHVAKLLLIDADNKYLMMHRTDHPIFGADPDIPGGTMEGTETLLETLLREVKEETQITIDPRTVEQVYSGADYSEHQTHYGLFVAKVEVRPEIVMSWEHSRYQWIECGEFLKQAKHAKDDFMHMVADRIESENSFIR